MSELVQPSAQTVWGLLESLGSRLEAINRDFGPARGGAISKLADDAENLCSAALLFAPMVQPEFPTEAEHLRRLIQEGGAVKECVYKAGVGETFLVHLCAAAAPSLVAFMAHF